MAEPNNEPIVELVNLPSRFEADAIIAALEANGIKAMASYGDVGGWAPNLATAEGHSVLVFESDLEAARAVLAEE